MYDINSSHRRAKDTYKMEWQNADNVDFSSMLSAPLHDPTTAGTNNLLQLGRSYTIEEGRILLGAAHTHCYKVALEGCRTTLWCTTMLSTGANLIGAKQLNTLTEGARVIVLRHPGTKTLGWIIGTIPEFNSNGQYGKSDQIFQGSRAGVGADTLYNDLLSFKRNGGMTNYSAHRFLDSLPFGESGWVTETGLATFIDTFMNFIRVDEANGLFLFKHGPRVRLAGTNFQFRTSGEEKEWLNDQNEFIMFGGSSPYFWEALGATEYGLTIHRNYTALQAQVESPEFGTREPLYDDQQPFHRIQEFGGYLGQAGKTQVILPADSETVTRYSTTPDRVGVFDEFTSLTGRHDITSAKGIHIAKRPIIAVPKMTVRPESATGDTPDNYKFAGLTGDGPDHLVKGEMEPAGAEAGEVTTASVADTHSLARWEGVHPFHYHTNDFYVSDDGAQGPMATDMDPPPFTDLRADQVMEPPEPVTIDVDHRYGAVRYWLNESYIDLLDDGGTVWGDGFGSEIRMSGGNIRISCPGDCSFDVGRSLVIEAGRDIILRAKRNIDGSATDQDIRFKAQEHFQIIGGNDDCERGGVIIENRSVCDKYDFTEVGNDAITSGIILKSPKAQIILDARRNIINSRGDETYEEPSLYLLAKDGRIKADADFHERVIGKAAIDIFPNEGTANEWWGNTALIETNIRVKGQLEVDGCVMVNGWLSITNGHIVTDMATGYANKVIQMSAGNITTQAALFTSLNARIPVLADAVTDELSDDLIASSAQEWHNATFSFRTMVQYKTSNYLTYESRWQQIARLGGLGLNSWIEKDVDANGTITYPYPGKENYLTREPYKTINPKLYDVATGLPIARSSVDYTTATYNNPTTYTLNSGIHKVID